MAEIVVIYTGPIVTCAEAKVAGLKRYFTGKPCPKGHISERRVQKSNCIQCGFENAKRWDAKNPDNARKRSRRHYYKHPHIHKKWAAQNLERMREASYRWKAKNPDKSRDACLKWRAKNPIKCRLYGSKRRARKRNAIGSHTAEQILDLFKKQKGKCAGCLCSIKRGWHNDHIIALFKGGSDYITNIQLLCQPCNNRKHTKDPIAWAQENGRLL